MKYYPININIKDKKCLVVGGGSVGMRKASTLIKAGAVTTVVSPEFISSFKDIESQGAILLEKKFDENDLIKMFLVICATDNSKLNFTISKHAKKRSVLCNIADLPDESDFILPSIIDRDELMITISTSGNSPALAKKIKKTLEPEFGSEYSDFLTIMGRIRKKLLSQNHAPDEHKIIFTKLINSSLLDTIKTKDNEKINSILHEFLDKTYIYEKLISGDEK